MSDFEVPPQNQPLLETVVVQVPVSVTPETMTILRTQWSANAYTFFTHNCMSFLFGLIAAFALKTLGQTIAILVVLSFIGIQCLAYYGYVKLNWSAVAGTIVRQLDFNNDGQVTWADMHVAASKFWKVFLTWGIPSTFAFVLGFYLGWKIL